MPCSHTLSAVAENALDRLDNRTARVIRARLQWPADNCEAVNHEALTGRFRGQFRLRVGPNRAIYTYDVAARHIAVISIRNRRTAYR